MIRFKGKYFRPSLVIVLLLVLIAFTALFEQYQAWVLPKALKAPLINASSTRSSDGTDSLTPYLKEVFSQARPATVQIKVLSPSIFSTFVQGMGTGFFISPDGLVLTAYHVVEQAKGKNLTASLAGGENYDLEIVSFDAYLDLALLRAEIIDKEVPYLDLETNPPLAGMEVLSIGNSGGNFLAGRLGYITRLNVSASRADFAPNTIEFSSRLAPGDSGGPVINSQGKVVGVVSYISYIPQDIIERSERFLPETLREILEPIFPRPYAAYAVPTLKDSKVISALLAGHKRDVPVIGIYGGNYSPKAFSENLGPLAGALVDRVPTSSPAAKAGLKGCQLGLRQIIISHKMGCLAYLPPQGRLPEGYAIKHADVIVAVNGQRTQSFSDLLTTVRNHQIGEVVTLTVQRNGETLELDVTLGAQAEVF